MRNRSLTLRSRLPTFGARTRDSTRSWPTSGSRGTPLLADPRFPDVVIDTDVASLIQKQRTSPWVNRYIIGARVWVTFVTVGEL